MRMKDKGVWAESMAAWRFVRAQHPELVWLLVLQTGTNLVGMLLLFGFCFLVCMFSKIVFAYLSLCVQALIWRS